MIYDLNFSRAFDGRPTRAAEIKILIEAHGDSDLCLEWPYKLRPDGYGICSYRGKECRVHRLAYSIANGELPDNLHVMHKCDNPSCFSPKHLISGLPFDNIHDMIAKNRHPKAMAKLSDDQVLEIRRRIETRRSAGLKYFCGGDTQTALAIEFGVTQTTISNIANRHRRKHV